MAAQAIVYNCALTLFDIFKVTLLMRRRKYNLQTLFECEPPALKADRPVETTCSVDHSAVCLAPRDQAICSYSRAKKGGSGGERKASGWSREHVASTALSSSGWTECSGYSVDQFKKHDRERIKSHKKTSLTPLFCRPRSPRPSCLEQRDFTWDRPPYNNNKQQQKREKKEGGGGGYKVQCRKVSNRGCRTCNLWPCPFRLSTMPESK